MENNSRQGDLADQAAGNNEVHIQLKLKQTDAKILQAIEEALWRLEKGHLRHLPRLRRADRAGPAQRDSVDAGLHHLQGKAKRVKATELLDLLSEFYRDKLAMRQRHVAAARLVSDYDFNNTYQYIIAREDLQLNWLRDAVTDMGGRAARRSGAGAERRTARVRRSRRRSSRRIATARRLSSTSGGRASTA